MHTDTERFNWLIEQLLTRSMTKGSNLSLATGIAAGELTCEGHISLGERIRTVIDNRLEKEITK
jgi:hypothetical protein